MGVVGVAASRDAAVSRRPRRLAVAVVLLLVLPTVALGAGGASAAVLLAGCPDGLSGLPGNDTLNLRCIDPETGDYEGYVRGGVFYQEATAVEPVQLDVPSSVIAAGEGSSATAAEGAGLAEADSVLGGGTIVETGEAAGFAGDLGPLGLAVAGGFELGVQTDHFACWAGVDWFCKPSAGPSYEPNGDVAPDTTGWFGPYSPGTWNYGLSNGNAVFAGGLTLDPSVWQYGQAAPSDPRVGATVTGTYSPASGIQYMGASLRVVCVNGVGSASYGGGTYYSEVLTAGSYTFSGNSGTYKLTHPTVEDNGQTCSSKGGVAFVALMGFSASPLSATTGLGGVTNWYTGATSPSNSPDFTDPSKYVEVWCPAGSPCAASQPAPDPARQFVTETFCSGGGEIDNGSAPFTEDDLAANNATVPAWPDTASCPAGQSVTKTKVIERTLDGSLPDKTLWVNTTPAAVTAWESTYPQCVNGVCRLGLYKVGTDGLLDSCWNADGTPDDDLCSGWFDDLSKSDDYVCTYGKSNSAADTQVDLSECNVYAPSFDPKKQAQGVGYGDPSTGKSPSTEPGTGSKNNPGSGSGDPDPGLGLPGGDGSSCWPSGWSAFNPAEWVLKPIKCALVWAFVPDSATVDALRTQMTTDLGADGLTAWGGGLTTLFGKLGGSGSGCTGPTVTFPLTDPPQQLQPFNACSDPMATVASISYAFSTVLVVVFGAMAGFKAVGSAFGYQVSLGDRLKASAS